MGKIGKGSASVLKIGVIYTISNFVVRGIAFLTTPLFTRLMTQSEYGDFSNVASWANIISVVITLSLYSSVNRAKYDYDREINSYMSSIVLFGTIVSGICWILVELKMDLFETLLSMDRFHIRVLLLFCLFSPAVQTLMAKCRMYGEYKSVILLTWITLLTSTCFSVLLVVIMPDKLDGRVLGNYGVVAIVDFIVWLYVIFKGRCFSSSHCKYALSLAVPLIPHELAGILLTSSDRIIIRQLCGPTDAGLYSLAYTIATIITVLLSSLNQAWVPWFYDRLSANEFDSIKKISKYYVLLFTFGCLGLMLIGPELVLVFGGKNYMEASYVIPPVCFAIELQFMYTLYVNIEFYSKKTITISLATIMATATNIGLNYLLIPKYGYIAAAYTTVIGYSLMMLFHYFVVNSWKRYRMVFDLKIILVSIGISAIAMIFTTMIYNYTFLRLIILLIYIMVLSIVLFRNKDRIRQWLSAKRG